MTIIITCLACAVWALACWAACALAEKAGR